MSCSRSRDSQAFADATKIHWHGGVFDEFTIPIGPRGPYLGSVDAKRESESAARVLLSWVSVLLPPRAGAATSAACFFRQFALVR